MVTRTHTLGPAFLDGGPKGLFIAGQATPAASGTTFATLNPSAGERLTGVAKGHARDIDLAVGAARRAFQGQWSHFKPFDRQQVMPMVRAATSGRDLNTAHRFARSLRTGTVRVDCHQVMDPAVPLGGYKTSGDGRVSGAPTQGRIPAGRGHVDQDRLTR